MARKRQTKLNFDLSFSCHCRTAAYLRHRSTVVPTERNGTINLLQWCQSVDEPASLPDVLPAKVYVGERVLCRHAWPTATSSQNASQQCKAPQCRDDFGSVGIDDICRPNVPEVADAGGCGLSAAPLNHLPLPKLHVNFTWPVLDFMFTRLSFPSMPVPTLVRPKSKP